MKNSRLASLRIISLAFLLPGLAGLVVSAVISTSYLDSLPRSPDADAQRTVPRNIHGAIVYQTPLEDRRLTIMEDASVAVFLVGLSMGLFYLRKWGRARTAESEGNDLSPAGTK